MREVELPSGAEVKVEEAGELDNDAGAVVRAAAGKPPSCDYP